MRIWIVIFIWCGSGSWSDISLDAHLDPALSCESGFGPSGPYGYNQPGKRALSSTLITLLNVQVTLGEITIERIIETHYLAAYMSVLAEEVILELLFWFKSVVPESCSQPSTRGRVLIPLITCCLNWGATPQLVSLSPYASSRCLVAPHVKALKYTSQVPSSSHPSSCTWNYERQAFFEKWRSESLMRKGCQQCFSWTNWFCSGSSCPCNFLYRNYLYL